jgi:rubrerythrin
MQASSPGVKQKRMRIHRNCCGLDVHKKIVAACLIREDAEGNSVSEKRLFRSMTRDLHELALGERDPARMADMAKKQLRKKIPSCSWRCRVCQLPHHRRLLGK